MHVTNDYLLRERALASYLKSLILESEEKYGEALLYACDAASLNNVDYSPLILIADIISCENDNRNVAEKLYFMSLDVARKMPKDTRGLDHDINRLQSILDSLKNREEQSD